MPLLAPFAPLVRRDLADALYKADLAALDRRPRSLRGKNRTRLRLRPAQGAPAGESETKQSAPSGGSETKQSAPSDGSETKQSAPASESGPKQGAPASESGPKQGAEEGEDA